ncbi:MAG: hypothetical protein LBB86_01280 [Oscillospiraceae bacterium]|jgi:hypothetical protein|nr:hypothetical protein [Oscillospiraceae bacterium]
MTPINQNPDAEERIGEEQYTEWQTPDGLADTETFPCEPVMEQTEPYLDADADAYADTDTYPNAYQAMLDAGFLSDPPGADCPETSLAAGYEKAEGGGCIYTVTFTKEVHDSLTEVVQSIAEGEIAGGKMLKASADAINRLTDADVSNGNNVSKLMSHTNILTGTVASLECVLTKKLCCTLASLCSCAQAPGGSDCFVLSTDMENALADIVSSIASQESAVSELITAGSYAMYITNEYGDLDKIQSVLECLGILVDMSASVEEALEKKLCLSLGAITSCDQEDLPASLRSALEDLIDSIADSETATSQLVATSAETLAKITESGNFEAILKAVEDMEPLTDAALRIERVTMHKLGLGLGALCGDDISDQLNCDLDNCPNICSEAVSANADDSWVDAQG